MCQRRVSADVSAEIHRQWSVKSMRLRKKDNGKFTAFKITYKSTVLADD